MVLMLSERSEKFLTQAGKERIDIINFFDEENNQVVFVPNDILFRHCKIPGLIIVPEVEKDNGDVLLRWTPTVRGEYEIIMNSIKLNTAYEIVVGGSTLDISKCQTTLINKKEVCYSEQS